MISNHDDFKPLDQTHLAWWLAAALTLWLIFISAAHFWVNGEESGRRIVTMGYMPVFSNMAAPILDQISQEGDGVRFKALKFASFAEMAESLRNGQIDAAFMIVPLAIVLRQQGEDVKMVLAGNRHESTLVTRSDLNIKEWNGLIGKTVAVPMRFSGHNLSILDELEKRGLTGQVNVVEMNPPDMASALAAGSLDAYYVGEPFAAKTLMSGESSLFHYVRDVWPGFHSNLVLVKNDLLQKEPEVARALIHGAARAGTWAKDHPEQAGKIASKYWNQPYDLVQYALNTPPDRIKFDQYEPSEQDMQYIADLMVRFGLIKSNDISGLVEPGLARSADVSNVNSLEDILPR